MADDLEKQRLKLETAYVEKKLPNLLKQNNAYQKEVVKLKELEEIYQKLDAIRKESHEKVYDLYTKRNRLLDVEYAYQAATKAAGAGALILGGGYVIKNWNGSKSGNKLRELKNSENKIIESNRVSKHKEFNLGGPILKLK